MRAVPKEFVPDRFRRKFDVYWIQTNKQTSKYIDMFLKLYNFTRKAKF